MRVSKLTADMDSSEELRGIRHDVSVRILHLTARATLAAAIAVVLLGIVIAGPELIIAGVLGGLGSLAAAYETRRPSPDVGQVLMVWLLIMATVVPIVPREAVLALAVPLASTAFIGGLLLGQRSARWVLAITVMVMVWQIAWLGATGGLASELLLVGVVQALGLASGAIVIRLTRDTLILSQTRYQSLFNGVPVGLFRSAPDGTILAANKRLVEILGFEDLGSLLSTNARDLYFDPDDRDRAIQATNDGSSQDVLFRLKRADGAQIWARETARHIYGPDGAVIGFEGVLEDVTERTEAHLSAKRAEERFAIAFEAAPIGMALVNARGEFQRVNQAFCDLVGVGHEQLTGMNWRDITPPEDEHLSAAPVQQMRPGDSIEIERRFMHSSGDVRWGRVSLSMFEAASDQAPNLVVQLVDMTPQKLLQDHLEGLVRAKDEFVASVSHELRTPLTAVMGLTRELVDHSEDFGAEEVAELLQIVAEQSTDVAHIVEDLLVAARADIGELTIAASVVDMASEVEQALKECSHLIRERSTTLLTPDHQVRAVVDPVRLRQIIRNLFTNALRYGGPTIEVELVNGPSAARLMVKDDGEGLPQKEWEAIFRPYHRAHTSHTAVGSMGLGLAVSKKLAEMMNGNLTYRYEDERSIFELSLPAPD